jgi:hypothetical protein
VGRAFAAFEVMIRFLFRFVGLVSLALAFILLIYDGTKSIAGNNLYLTSVRALWDLINAASLARLKPAIEPYANGYLWDPMMLGFLSAPSWAVLGIVGIVFIVFGRKKKPLIGYARP